MSYILDALLKADTERQPRTLPGLQTRPLPSRERPGWMHSGCLLLAGAVVGGSGLFLAGDVLTSIPGAPPQASFQTLAPHAALEPAKGLPSRRRERRPSLIPARPEGESTRIRASPRLYRIDELPEALQKEVRNISVAGFAQSPRAGETMAIINDRALREGDEVAAGLRVERISDEGVVFNLKGYRFRKRGAGA